jgi:hypothetical protein
MMSLQVIIVRRGWRLLARPLAKAGAGEGGRGQGRIEPRCTGVQLQPPGRESPDPANDNAESYRLIEAELQAMMDAGDVAGARRRLAQLSPEERAHPRLARWARALEPPRVRIGAPGSTPSLEKNAAWLRKHGADYFGQWVALREGELLGSNPDYRALNRELERRGELAGALFVRLAEG